MATCPRLRELHCELGLLHRADGSARVTQGATSVLCSVFGPADVKISKEQSEKAVLELVLKPASGLSGPKERLLEQQLIGCCESVVLTKLHPHTALSVTLQVENDAGALFSTLVHACCLALLDASIPMSTVFAAVTCGFSEDGELILDPDRAQEQKCESLLTFVVNCNTDNIISSYTEGAFSLDQLKQAMSVSQETAKSIGAFYRKSVRRKFSKDAKFAHLNVAV